MPPRLLIHNKSDYSQASSFKSSTRFPMKRGLPIGNKQQLRRSRSRSSHYYSYSSMHYSSSVQKNSRSPLRQNHTTTKKGSVSSGSIDRSKDADHFIWHKGQLLGTDQRYKVLEHLGDGTFGRALKCQDMQTNEILAVKVIRAVPRYTDSARIEADILKDLKAKGGVTNHVVDLKHYFYHNQNMCLVFEPLGKSLYDFIKANNYKGFEIGQVREIAF